MDKDIEKAIKPGILRNSTGYIVLLIAIAGLILSLQYGSYLLFHGFVEVFSIVIAGAIFIFAWHSRHIIDNQVFVIIGIAYLGVGTTDFLHMLAYRGMGVFPSHDSDLPTQLWILARYIEGSAYLLAALLIHKRIRPNITLLLYTVAVTLAIMSILIWDIFPASYIEGTGLTTFKIASEYAISAMLAAAVWLFWKNKDRFDRNALTLLTAAIAVTILSEMAFTLYADVYGVFNAIGHFLKAISFYLTYRAILAIGLEKPYAVSYKKLKDREELLHKERDFIQNVVDTVQTIILRLDMAGKIVSFNRYFEEISGYRLEEVKGQSWFDIFLPERSREQTKELFQQSIRDIPTQGNVDIIVTKQGEERYIEWHDTALTDPGGKIIELLSTGQDVTERIQMEEAIKESEEKFRYVFDNSALGKSLTSISGAVNVNAAFCKMLGYSQEELENRPWQSITHPEDVEPSQKILGSLLSDENKTARFTKRYIHKDGSLVWADVITSLRRDADGKPLYYITSVLDITESKQTVDALRESEAFSRSVLENSPNPMTIVNEDTSLAYVNPAFEKLLGYKEEEVLGLKAPYPWWPEDVRASRILDLDASMKGILSINDDVVSKDGQRFTIKMNVAQVKYGKGKTGHLAHWTDVTELKHLEESLALSLQEWEKTFDSMPDRICIIDKDYRILRTNKTFRNHFKISDEEISKKRCYELVCGKTEPIQDCPHLDTFTTGAISAKEEFHPSNSTWVQITTSPITDENGEIIANVHITRDITERKQLENERAISSKLESIGTLAGGIAHDFNNLLAIISGNSSLALRLHETDDKDTTRKVLEEVEKAAIRGTSLTRQLLTFAKGGVPIKKITSIAALIEESANFAIRGSQASCEFEIANDLWPVECDEGQLNQVITNLVLNGVQAMPGGGVIKITAGNTVITPRNKPVLPQGHYVQISIEDHGTGIAEKYLDKIFDPYFTTKKRGSGLGLSTSYSIIKNHGGRITVESTIDIGTTFHIYMPAAKRKAAEVTAESIQPALIGRGRILVMDDEDAIREMLRNILTNAGYEVTLTENGTETVKLYKQAKAAKKPFKAVIMDLTIPGGMGGKETIKELLNIDPSVKAIVSSGYANDAIIANYKEHGFKAVVNKPYTTGEIEMVLKKLLAKRK